MLDLTPWRDRTVEEAQALLDDVVAVQDDWATEFVSRFGQDRDAMLLDGTLASLTPAWEWFMENLQLEPIEIELPQTIERLEEAFGGLDLHPWMLVKRGGLEAGGPHLVWLSSYLSAYWCSVLSSILNTSWYLGTDKEDYNSFLFAVRDYDLPQFPPALISTMALHAVRQGRGSEVLLERSLEILAIATGQPELQEPEIEPAWTVGVTDLGEVYVWFCDEIAHVYEEYVLEVEALLKTEAPHGVVLWDGDREFVSLKDESDRPPEELRQTIEQLLNDRAPDPRT